MLEWIAAEGGQHGLRDMPGRQVRDRWRQVQQELPGQHEDQRCRQRLHGLPTWLRGHSGQPRMQQVQSRPTRGQRILPGVPAWPLQQQRPLRWQRHLRPLPCRQGSQRWQDSLQPLHGHVCVVADAGRVHGLWGRQGPGQGRWWSGARPVSPFPQLRTISPPHVAVDTTRTVGNRCYVAP